MIGSMPAAVIVVAWAWTGEFFPDEGAGIWGYYLRDQRACALADYGIGRLDLVVTQSGGQTRLFRNNKAKPGLRVRLREARPIRMPSARLRVCFRKPAIRCLWHGESGRWVAATISGRLVKVLAMPQLSTAIEVRWPSGKTTRTSLPAGLKEITMTAGQDCRQVTR